jgi:hypothetical protein
MLTFNENPIEVAEVRGISKREKKQVDLTIEQCFFVFDLLPSRITRWRYQTFVLGCPPRSSSHSIGRRSTSSDCV